MPLTSMDELGDQYDEDALWEIAANVRNHPRVRHEAIRRWLNIDEYAEEAIPTERMLLLRQRATPLDPDEVEEDDIEELERKGPFFDHADRLIVEYNGERYVIDPLDDDAIDADTEMLA